MRPAVVSFALSPMCLQTSPLSNQEEHGNGVGFPKDGVVQGPVRPLEAHRDELHGTPAGGLFMNLIVGPTGRARWSRVDCPRVPLHGSEFLLPGRDSSLGGHHNTANRVGTSRPGNVSLLRIRKGDPGRYNDPNPASYVIFGARSSTAPGSIFGPICGPAVAPVLNDAASIGGCSERANGSAADRANEMQPLRSSW
jgi:hypothetical protein